MDYGMVDSGKRQEFTTGAVRDTREGKGRFDLIPPGPLFRLAVVYEKGGKKYEDRNWEKGIPVSRFMDSAIRHLNSYMAGSTDEDHLGQAVFNIFGAMHFEDKCKAGLAPPELFDIPSQANPWLESIGSRDHVCLACDKTIERDDKDVIFWKGQRYHRFCSSGPECLT